MKENIRVIAALAASAAAPATAYMFFVLLLILVSGHPDEALKAFIIFALVFIVALLHAVILGLPAYLFLRKKNLVRRRTSIWCGFVIGCLPTALITFPHTSPGEGFISNGVKIVVNGVTTPAGWMEYILGVLQFGVCGMVGAFAAWFVWQRCGVRAHAQL